MSAPYLSGSHIRLAVMNSDEDLKCWAGWMRDSEFMRLLDSAAAMLYTPDQIRGWLEKELGGETLFGIRTLADDRLIGFIGLSGFDWAARSAWVAIGIGERAYWGQGLGSEAMRLMQRYAFESLNLNRINLTVFGYNQRAIRSYVKCGFQEEGRARQFLNRFEQRWDMVYMGILRAEWQAQPAV
jgi:RimJ/RimL family protein N-acetyltransferase